VAKPIKFEYLWPHIWEDWTAALIAVVATILLVPLVESALHRLSKRGEKAAPWQQLIACNILPLSRILYPIGLSVFIDAAPLEPKLAHQLSDFDFFLFVVFIAMFLRRSALWGIVWYTSLQDARNTQAALQNGFIPLLKNVITLLAVLCATITTLTHFGYNVMSLVAALGVGSLAVGLAAQSTLSNMFSGFILIIDRNLRPGDRISLGGVVGLVQEIGLRSTRLDLRDGTIMIVPNSDLVNSRIINLSMTHDRFSASTKFSIPLNVPVSHIRKIALETIALVPKARKKTTPSVLISSLADGQQLISVGFGIADPDDQAEALSQFHEALLQRLTSEGLSLSAAPVAPP
jgi:small-conductance mechanosensitive channel